MPSVPAVPHCPHELRAGLTVCLHCRHEALMAARRRRLKTAARLGKHGAVLAGVLAVGVYAAGAAGEWRDWARSLLAAEPAATAQEPAATRARPAAVATPVMMVAATRSGPPEVAPAVVRAAPLVPRVREGRTELGEGLFAERSGDTVTVHFDTPLARTRRPEKFERIVRATLAQVYGAGADSALAALPQGAIANAGDLLTELPRRGVHIPVSGGWTLTVLPITRPGRDGPLVVTYRATVAR